MCLPETGGSGRAVESRCCSLPVLPGLRSAAMRAGDGRCDGRREQVAALAGVGGLVERASGRAHALDGDVAGLCRESRLDLALVKRHAAPACGPAPARVPVGEGVKENARAHGLVSIGTRRTGECFAPRASFPGRMTGIGSPRGRLGPRIGVANRLELGRPRRRGRGMRALLPEPPSRRACGLSRARPDPRGPLSGLRYWGR